MGNPFEMLRKATRPAGVAPKGEGREQQTAARQSGERPASRVLNQNVRRGGNHLMAR